VQMTCMTTKQKFDVEQPEVVVLRNGRYAYRAECPWEGKGGKKLISYKFCCASEYEEHIKRGHDEDTSEEDTSEKDSCEEDGKEKGGSF
jgi:hypothetical protein